MLTESDRFHEDSFMFFFEQANSWTARLLKRKNVNEKDVLAIVKLQKKNTFETMDGHLFRSILKIANISNRGIRISLDFFVCQ